MADHKKCKKCKKSEEDCKCPKKGRIGYYGLDKDYDEDEDGSQDAPLENGNMSGGEGGLGEAVKMPREPRETDRHMRGISSEKKRKKLDAFRAQADEAKKRQRDEDRKGELAKERRTKGIRFYDAKGSGYIRDGKKNYD